MTLRTRSLGSIFGAPSLLAVACFSIWLIVSTANACETGVAEIRGEWGSARFRVEVADSEDERRRGLMFRERLPTQSGMLFLYERPGPASFWMKNTLIPLDIIFLGESGAVKFIHSNARPGSLAPITGGDGILAVLEINGGMADQLGLGIGSQLRHPKMPQSKAIWPCD